MKRCWALGFGLLPTLVAGADYQVMIPAFEFRYEPANLTVVEGDTVGFDFSDFHPFRQVIGPPPSTTPPLNALLCDGSITTPCARKMTLSVANQAETFYYICVTHHTSNDMFGQVLILPQLLFADGLE